MAGMPQIKKWLVMISFVGKKDVERVDVREYRYDDGVGIKWTRKEASGKRK
jgi:hypothetical protein